MLVFLKLDFAKAYDRLLEGFFLIHFLFNLMKPLKIFMLVHFFQLVIQAQDLFILDHFQRESTSTSFDFIRLRLELFHFDVGINNCKFVFETFWNALILHDFKISYVYNLLLNQYLSNWVKTKSMTSYSWFLTSQYDDMR